MKNKLNIIIVALIVLIFMSTSFVSASDDVDNGTTDLLSGDATLSTMDSQLHTSDNTHSHDNNYINDGQISEYDESISRSTHESTSKDPYKTSGNIKRNSQDNTIMTSGELIPTNTTLNVTINNQTLLLDVSLSTVDGELINDATIYFMTDKLYVSDYQDNYIKAITVNGYATAEVPIERIGISELVEIKALFRGDDQYNSSTSEGVTVNLSEYREKSNRIATDTSLSVDVLSQSAFITVNVTSDESTLINEGEVYFIVKDKYMLYDWNNRKVVLNVTNSTAQVMLTKLTLDYGPDLCHIRAVFNGTEHFLSSTSEEVIANVSSSYTSQIQEPEINFDLTFESSNDYIFITANITDDEGSPVDDGLLYIYQGYDFLMDNSRNKALPVNNGRAVLSVYRSNLRYTYNGHADFRPIYLSADNQAIEGEVIDVDTFNLNSIKDRLIDTKTTLKVTVEGDMLTLYGNVTTPYSTNITGGSIHFVVNNTDNLTDNEGNLYNITLSEATFNMTIPIDDLMGGDVDSVEVKAVYTGYYNYQPSSSDNVVINNTVDEIIITNPVYATNTSILAYRNDQSTYITVTVEAEDNKRINRGDVLYILIDGKRTLNDDNGDTLYLNLTDSRATLKVYNRYINYSQSNTTTIQAVFIGLDPYLSSISEAVEVNTSSYYNLHSTCDTITSIIPLYQDETRVSVLVEVTLEDGRWINRQSYAYFVADDQRILTYDDGSIIYANVSEGECKVDLPITSLWPEGTDTLNLRAVYEGCYLYNTSSSDNIELCYTTESRTLTDIDRIYTTKTILDYVEVLDGFVNVECIITSNDKANVDTGRVYFIINNDTILKDTDDNTVYADITGSVTSLSIPIEYFNMDSFEIKAVFNATVEEEMDVNSGEEITLKTLYLPSTSYITSVNLSDSPCSVEYKQPKDKKLNLTVDVMDDYVYLTATLTSLSDKPVESRGVVSFRVGCYSCTALMNNSMATLNISRDYMAKIDHVYMDNAIEYVELYNISAKYLADVRGFGSIYSDDIIINFTTKSRLETESDELFSTSTRVYSHPETGLYAVVCNQSGERIELDEKFYHDYPDGVFYILNNTKISGGNLPLLYNTSVVAVFPGYGRYVSSVSIPVFVSYRGNLINDTVEKKFVYVRHETVDNSNVKVEPTVTNEARSNEASTDIKSTTTATINTYSLPEISLTSKSSDYHTSESNSNVYIDRKSDDSSMMTTSTTGNIISSLATSSLYTIPTLNKASTTVDVSTTSIGLTRPTMPLAAVTINPESLPASPISQVLSILPAMASSSTLSVASNVNGVLSSLGLTSVYTMDSHEKASTSTSISTSTIASSPQALPALSIVMPNNLLTPSKTTSILSAIPNMIQSASTYTSTLTNNPISRATSKISVLPCIIQASNTIGSSITKVVSSKITSSFGSIIPSILASTKSISLFNIFMNPQGDKTQISQTQTNTLITQMVTVVPENTYILKVDDKEVYNGTIVTFTILGDIFGQDFRNSHVLVYLDGQVIYNGTLDDNLEVELLKLVESLVGVHELKVEYTDSNNNTKILTKNITVE